MKYNQLRNNLVVFIPLRAIGLAMELALKAGILKGFWMVQEEDIKQV